MELKVGRGRSVSTLMRRGGRRWKQLKVSGTTWNCISARGGERSSWYVSADLLLEASDRNMHGGFYPLP